MTDQKTQVGHGRLVTKNPVKMTDIPYNITGQNRATASHW